MLQPLPTQESPRSPHLTLDILDALGLLHLAVKSQQDSVLSIYVRKQHNDLTPEDTVH
jgi:hypothetical protein